MMEAGNSASGKFSDEGREALAQKLDEDLDKFMESLVDRKVSGAEAYRAFLLAKGWQFYFADEQLKRSWKDASGFCQII